VLPPLFFFTIFAPPIVARPSKEQGSHAIAPVSETGAPVSRWSSSSAPIFFFPTARGKEEFPGPDRSSSVSRRCGDVVFFFPYLFDSVVSDFLFFPRETPAYSPPVEETGVHLLKTISILFCCSCSFRIPKRVTFPLCNTCFPVYLSFLLEWLSSRVPIQRCRVRDMYLQVFLFFDTSRDPGACMVSCGVWPVHFPVVGPICLPEAPIGRVLLTLLSFALDSPTTVYLRPPVAAVTPLGFGGVVLLFYSFS